MKWSEGKEWCPLCSVDLEWVEEHFPYTPDHLQCPQCDGTFNIGQIESLQFLNRVQSLRPICQV